MARDETIKLSLVDGVTKSFGQIPQRRVWRWRAVDKTQSRRRTLQAKAFGLVGSCGVVIGNAVQGAADIGACPRFDITQATTADRWRCRSRAVMRYRKSALPIRLQRIWC